MYTAKCCFLSVICAAASFPVFGGEAITYYHSDLIGSPVAATDPAGYVRWRAAYRPYGDRDQTATEQLASADNKKWFTGHVHDEETGLTYAGARYYDPTLGRFLSVDPIGFEVDNEQSFGRYTYVNNNPYVYVDPTGAKLVFAAGSTEQFKADFAKAIAYHNEHGTSGVFARLEELPEIITIQEGTQAHRHAYDPNNKTILFSPRYAGEEARRLPGTEEFVGTGKVITPALALLHEAGHAKLDVTDPERWADLKNTPDSVYGDANERYVTERYEHPAARRLGEPIRTGHDGYTWQVACVTCTY